jgi:hypothetical protein
VFTAVYDTKVLTSGYQSIDMHCIVVPVKFDGGLIMSFLKKSNSLKKMDVKSSQFKFHFFGVHFSCERDERPNFKFDKESEVLFIYRRIPRKPNFLG